MKHIRSKWAWWLILLSRRIWFRAALFALLSIASALIASVLAPLIPPGLSSDIGADAVGNILEILASSMLVVATFSLSTMISAYAAASRSTTPRVTELLMQDSRAQNALSTFVGAFLFSLVSIVGLSSGIYGPDGQLVLFAITVLVIGVIVITFLRWVELLSNFGRIPDAIRRTADAATDALTAFREEPYLGGHPDSVKHDAEIDITDQRMGYLRHIDMGELQEVAEENGGVICVLTLPGAFIDATRPVARVSFEADNATAKKVCAALDIGDDRTYDQDPGYGISALAEIGVKALSPSVNDPVTAIRVIDRIVQVLSGWTEASGTHDVRFDRVYVPPLDAKRLFAAAFADLAQYGAGNVSVAVRLQRALLSLARGNTDAVIVAAREQSGVVLQRARNALALDEDVQRVARLAGRIS